MLYPVEGLATRQAVENFAGPLPDEVLHVGQVARRYDGLNGLALHVMARRVHGDEHLQLRFTRWWFGDGNTTICPV